MNVILHQFDYSINEQDWQILESNLTAVGYSPHELPAAARYQRLPEQGVHTVFPAGSAYMTEAGELLYDWALYPISARRRVGYWLELPVGSKPKPPIEPDTSQLSTIKQAIHWLRSEPGRSQAEAARLFKCGQGNISNTLRKMRGARK